jgi:hypothetical protein
MRASIASTSRSCRPSVSANDVDGALHALQHVDAQQVDQALFAIDLPEGALAAADLSAVLPVVGFLLAGQHVTQRRVRPPGAAADLEVDVADAAELAVESTSALMLTGFSRSGNLPVSLVP